MPSEVSDQTGVKDTPDAPSLPDILDVRTFMSQELPDPPELVRGILHQGSKLVLGGSSKSFKTWTLLDLALSIAHGKPWLGFETVQGRVLYVNFEIQDYFWQSRIDAVAQAKGIDLDADKFCVWNLRGHAANHATLLPSVEDVVPIRDLLAGGD